MSEWSVDDTYKTSILSLYTLSSSSALSGGTKTDFWPFGQFILLRKVFVQKTDMTKQNHMTQDSMAWVCNTQVKYDKEVGCKPLVPVDGGAYNQEHRPLGTAAGPENFILKSWPSQTVFRHWADDGSEDGSSSSQNTSRWDGIFIIVYLSIKQKLKLNIKDNMNGTAGTDLRWFAPINWTSYSRSLFL